MRELKEDKIISTGLKLNKNEKKILIFLIKNSEGINQKEITQGTEIPQPSVSLSVKSLKEKGLVSVQRNGKNRIVIPDIQAMEEALYSIYSEKGIKFNLTERAAEMIEAPRGVNLHSLSSRCNISKEYLAEFIREVNELIKVKVINIISRKEIGFDEIVNLEIKDFKVIKLPERK